LSVRYFNFFSAILSPMSEGPQTEYGWEDWEQYFYLLLCDAECERCGAIGDVSDCMSRMEPTEASAEKFSICASRHMTSLGCAMIDRFPHCPLCAAIVRALADSD